MNFPNYMFRRMNEQIVWQLIEYIKTQGEDTVQQTEQLIIALSEWSVDHIFVFQKIYFNLLRKAHTTDLWAAATILNRTDTEEEFLFFKNWLIFQGQVAYKGVLNDSEYLIELLKDSNYLYQNTTLHLVTLGALKLKDKNAALNLALPILELNGKKAETQEELIDVLPKLCQKLGWGNDVYKGDWHTDSTQNPSQESTNY